jgi:hypothetical protein
LIKAGASSAGPKGDPFKFKHIHSFNLPHHTGLAEGALALTDTLRLTPGKWLARAMTFSMSEQRSKAQDMYITVSVDLNTVAS